MVAAPKLFTTVADGLRITSSHHIYDRARDEPLTLSSGASKRTIPATEVVVSEFWRLDATAQAALAGSFDPTPDNPMQGIFRASQFVPFTPIFNATGQPALSVPLYWNQDNVPIGVQFAARCGYEATLFRLAAQLEQARPWADRWPVL